MRDSGVAHALLGIASLEQLVGHPVVGQSWEGYVIETLLSALPPLANAYFYRTSADAEIDLNRRSRKNSRGVTRKTLL